MVESRKVWYSTGSDFRHSVSTIWDIDDEQEIEEIAQDCAEDFHSNHDGWECAWPRDFTIYRDEDGPAVSTLEVEREHEAVFIATHLSSAK